MLGEASPLCFCRHIVSRGLYESICATRYLNRKPTLATEQPRKSNARRLSSQQLALRSRGRMRAVRPPMAENTLYFGDNLKILRENIRDETVDLIYLDP